MIANKWYCIAQTGTFDSGCTINVSFDSYVIQFSASVKYGSSAINITRCELPLSANLSLRLRESNGLWSVDLLSNNDITPEIVVADSPYWVAVNSVAGAGNIILTLKDISKDFNTETGGSGGGLNENELRAFLDKYGYTQARDFWKYETTGGGAIHTDYHIIVDGGGAFGGAELGGGGESGGGGISEFYIQLGEGGQKYKLGNSGLPNVVQIPKYPVVPTNVSEFYNDAGYIGGEQAALIFSRIGEVEARVEKLEKLWWVDENGNLHTTYNIVVEGGGAFGTGASVDAGGSGGLGRVILVNDSGTEYASDENGIVRIPDYIAKAWFDAQKFATQSWVLNKGYVSESVLVPIREDITTLKKDVADLKGMWTIKDGKLYTEYSIVVKGGGAFGEGSESGGSSTGGLGQITIRNQAGQEYKTDANGVVVIPTYLTSNALDGYATQQWVEGQKYLKSIPTEYITENELTAKGYALSSDLTKVGNRVTTLEGNFNGAIAKEAAKVSHALTFGSKTYDGSIARTILASDLDAVTLSGEQIITGAKTFSSLITANGGIKIPHTASLKIGDITLIEEDGALKVLGNLVVTGGGAFGAGATTGGGGGEGFSKIIIQTEGGQSYTTNDAGVVTIPNYITSAALNGYATQSWVEGKKYLTAIPSEYVTETELSNTLGGYQTKITSSNKLAYSLISGTPTLATVATSGKYSDLSGTPSSLPASDVYAWAKAASKPAYTASEVGALPLSGGTLTGVLTIHADNVSGKQQGLVLSDPGYGSGEALKIVWKSSTYTDGVYLSGLPDINALDFNGNIVIHSGNYSSYALPLSGGTISGSLTVSRDAAVPFYIKNTQATNTINQATLRFVIGSNYGAGLLGKSADSNLYRTDVSLSASYKIVDTGNYADTTDQRYLQLSGGTMTGAIMIGGYTSFGVNDGIFYLGNPSYPVYVRSNGIVNINGNAVIHAGNIGSYALKIDGSNAMTAPLILAYNSSLTEDKGIYVGTTHVAGGAAFDYASFVNIHDNRGSSLQLSWYRHLTQPQLVTRISENGSWSAWKTIAFTDSNVASATQVMVNYSYNQDVNYPLLFTSRDNIGVAKNGSLYTDYYGKITYNPQKDVLTVGNIAGNASSATKLQTARTIWGQNFDGTGNVDGKIYQEGKWIIGLHPDNNLYIGYDSKSLGNTLLFGNEIQTYNSIGSVTSIIKNNGNVLIGTATDSGYKLDVRGGNIATDYGIVGVSSSTYNRWSITHGSNRLYIQSGLTDGSGTSGDVWISGINTSSLGLLNIIATTTTLSGNLVVTGGGAFGSDVRYKDILDYANIDLATIADAPLFTYKWNDREDKKVYLGTSAQYWLNTAFTNAVNTDNPNFYHLDYGALGVGLAIATARKVVDHEERIATLEKENRELKEKLNKYETLWHN